jgi:DNA-binding XRE family transcriptional regulator
MYRLEFTKQRCLPVSVQIIAKDGQPEWAVLPYAEYEILLEAAEMLADIRAYDDAKSAMAHGEEILPGELAFALLDGANPIMVWRKHRGLAQQDLASEAGISKAYLSQLEAGKRKGTTEVLTRVAQALRVDLDDLV